MNETLTGFLLTDTRTLEAVKAERTEARAEAFRAQERVRELTEILRHAYAWMLPDGCDCGTDEQGSCALCETERVLDIATKRREGK